MNLRQFYETVIFRDLVNHTLPGSVALIGVGMVGSAVVSRLDLAHSLSDFLRKSGAFGNNVIIGIVVFVGLAYIAGNALSAFFPLIRHRKQATLAYDTLNACPWLRQQVTVCLADYFQVSVTQAQAWLDDAGTVRALRETCRQLAQKDHPHLYQEFVGRYSVLSIFSLNMACVMIGLLLSAGIAAWISWPIVSVSSQFKANEGFLIVVSIVTSMSILGLAWLFWVRAYWLRKRMIRHTFEIWLIGYPMDRKAPSVVVPDLEIQGSLELGEGERVLYSWR